MRLVHIEPVYTELFKGHNIVLAGGVVELLQLGLQIFLGALQLLDGKALGAAGLELRNAVLDLPNLLLQEPLLPFSGNGDALKLAVTDDNGVIVAGGNAGAELLAVACLKVLFGSHKDIGGETGFLVGAMTMLVSNMLFSQGPWTPWQMFAMGAIGWLAGILYRKGVLRRSKLSLCIFGVIASTVIYGGIMNPASALMWAQSVNWKIILSYYISGIPVDLVRAIATFFFLWLGAEPMLEKLDRIKTKYGLAE